MERKEEYLDLFASDFLVVLRNGKVVRVMGNKPGSQVVFLELGSADGSTPPSVTYYGPLDTGWDPFEIEAYVEEYLRRLKKEPEWKKDLEATLQGVEEFLAEDQTVAKVTIDRDGTTTTEEYDRHA